MNSKKKVIVAISALAMVILAAIIAVIAVLAAQQVSVKSSVNITYTADAEVIGSVSARYAMQNGTNKELGTVEFDGEEIDNSSENLTAVGDITFTKDNSYIDFTFTFVNDSEVALYTATLKFTDSTGAGNGTITNMNLEGKTDVSLTFSDLDETSLTSLTSLTIPAGQTVIYTLRVGLASTAKDAAFTGTMQWNIEATR